MAHTCRLGALSVALMLAALAPLASADHYEYHYEVWGQAEVSGTITLYVAGAPVLEVADVGSWAEFHWETGATCEPGVGSHYNFRDAQFSQEVMGEADGFLGAVWTYNGMTFYSGQWDVAVVGGPGQQTYFSDKQVDVRLAGGYADPDPSRVLDYLNSMLYNILSDDAMTLDTYGPGLVAQPPTIDLQTAAALLPRDGLAPQAETDADTSGLTGPVDQVVLQDAIDAIRDGEPIYASYDATGFQGNGLVDLQEPEDCY